MNSFVFIVLFLCKMLTSNIIKMPVTTNVMTDVHLKRILIIYLLIGFISIS
ncbi:hypothetical protein INE81_01435 [Bacteroides salyersiae]|nr:hypothetical protein INE81_01435 [Bacteroides salyersiae]